jgi:energy-coupling factor transport system substrate-specific component
MRSAILPEIFSKRGLRAALITTIIYSLLLIPFKQFVIIDSITEVRPANVVPVIMGILLGPGAAVGAAAGNLVGDLFGTLTWGSVGGFVGNFAFALFAWLTWSRLAALDAEKFDIKAAGRYLVAAIVASLVCAGIIAAGLQLAGIGDLIDAFVIIAVNNLSWTCSLGLIIIWPMYGPIRKREQERAIAEDVQ